MSTHENVLRKESIAAARRLLCATDLTERSDHAVQRTGQLARQLDARVVFVHALVEVLTELLQEVAGRAARSLSPLRNASGAPGEPIAARSMRSLPNATPFWPAWRPRLCTSRTCRPSVCTSIPPT